MTFHVVGNKYLREATSRSRDLFGSQFEGISVTTVRSFIVVKPFHSWPLGYETLGIHKTLGQEADKVAWDQGCIIPKGPPRVTDSTS